MCDSLGAPDPGKGLARPIRFRTQRVSLCLHGKPVQAADPAGKAILIK
jgi:hypothetical protein